MPRNPATLKINHDDLHLRYAKAPNYPFMDVVEVVKDGDEPIQSIWTPSFQSAWIKYSKWILTNFDNRYANRWRKMPAYRVRILPLLYDIFCADFERCLCELNNGNITPRKTLREQMPEYLALLNYLAQFQVNYARKHPDRKTRFTPYRQARAAYPSRFEDFEIVRQ